MIKLTTESKSALIAEYSGDANNTGHAEAQVAIFTHRISHLTEHLKKNKKDLSISRRFNCHLIYNGFGFNG